ncbi:MAG: LPXTG cell wall anchor domain-containing protein, partial [bacterium]
ARNGSATLRAHPVDNSGAVATASITITGAGTGGVTLPKTGRNILTYVGLGLLLLVLGWLMIMYVRARRRRSDPGRHPSTPAETTKV